MAMVCGGSSSLPAAPPTRKTTPSMIVRKALLKFSATWEKELTLWQNFGIQLA